jgi:hypothetical protein
MAQETRASSSFQFISFTLDATFQVEILQVQTLRIRWSVIRIAEQKKAVSAWVTDKPNQEKQSFSRHIRSN